MTQKKPEAQKPLTLSDKFRLYNELLVVQESLSKHQLRSMFSWCGESFAQAEQRCNVAKIEREATVNALHTREKEIIDMLSEDDLTLCGAVCEAQSRATRARERADKAFEKIATYQKSMQLYAGGCIGLGIVLIFTLFFL